MIRKHIVFSGRVQGVGFRWRAGQAARLYDCTGWCRNEWDGSVTMEIQGKEEDVDKVLESLENGRFIWIHHMDVTEVPTETGEYGFDIRD